GKRRLVRPAAGCQHELVVGDVLNLSGIQIPDTHSLPLPVNLDRLGPDERLEAFDLLKEGCVTQTAVRGLDEFFDSGVHPFNVIWKTAGAVRNKGAPVYHRNFGIR